MNPFIPLALADSGCTLNGEEIPCDELWNAAQPFLALGIPLLLFMLALGLAGTVFWIMMIVHAATHDIKDKAMWIILMIFTGIIGALIYYFVVKRELKK